MTPDVVVDIGNSRMKWGRVLGGRVSDVVSLRHDDPVGWKRQAEAWGLVAADAGWAVAGVVPRAVGRLREWLTARGAIASEVTTATIQAGRRLAVRTNVDEPGRLGVDRLLTSLAAKQATPPNTAVVAINVGTAMTVDFVEPDGTHVGGAILPGPRLMARSLHKRTAKLPQIKLTRAVPTRIWGANTEAAIGLGIASAILGAADQLVWDWAVHCGDRPWVFVTGGDAGYFRGFVLTADTGNIVFDPTLTLEGVRLAAEALP